MDGLDVKFAHELGPALLEALQSPSSRSSHILVIMPVTLLDQWAKVGAEKERK